MAAGVQAIGMAWFKRENFDRLRRLFKDGHKLHRTYDEWLAAAEAGRKRYEVQGFRVVCVDIDPDHFPEWCREKGHEVDANGRTAYASYIAYKIITGMEPPAGVQ
jgi:hypothetical protein